MTRNPCRLPAQHRYSRGDGAASLDPRNARYGQRFWQLGAASIEECCELPVSRA